MEPFEVIVVDSGQDGIAEYVRARYPDVRIVRSETRLRPAAAATGASPPLGDVRGVPSGRRTRASGLAAPARGQAPGGFRRRRRRDHERDAGASDRERRFEYSALIPSDRVLAEQVIPHTLSFERELLERLGPYPEDVAVGEDTVLNRRLVEAGVEVGFDGRIQFAHENLRRLARTFGTSPSTGAGTWSALRGTGAGSLVGPLDQPTARALWRIFAPYPARRYLSAAGRIRRGRPTGCPAS